VGALLAGLALAASSEGASAMTRRVIGKGAVVYEPGPSKPGSLSASAANGAVVIEVNRRAPPAGRRKTSPGKALQELLSGNVPIQSQARLVEDAYRRMGILVPASFAEQTLFGRLVQDGKEVPGDLLFFAAPDGRTPAYVALVLGPGRTIVFSRQTSKPIETPRGKLPWTGKLLFARRILGTVFEQYLQGPLRADGTRPRPAGQANPLPEHYRTEMEGIASLYGNGDGSHGRHTANGEIFNEEALTAAHRTLPFNTWVLVTNVENGRRVIVRVNDRGPFAQKERVVDLSFRAARLLGMERQGTAQVKLSVIRVAHENDA
jgi:hypothetical protein